jgi:hypothetical protein
MCCQKFDITYDITCELSPCVIEVANGSLEPVLCPYGNECTFCRWEKSRMTNKIFEDEDHLKRRIDELLSLRSSCEWYDILNRKTKLNIENELYFIFDKYDELY